MAYMFTHTVLRMQNRMFARTGGVSQENRELGFVPAFRDEETGSVYVSCLADGRPAPIHVLDGLPEDLVLGRTPSGHVCAVKGTVTAGFVRGGCFYTREQAAGAVEGDELDPFKNN